MKPVAPIRSLLLATALAATPALAQDRAPAPLPAVALPKAIVTRHSGTFNGKRIAYDANVEPFDVTGTDGRPSARLVAISYVARNAAPERPVLFIFNGGPITASYILHMGAFGPKRVAVPDDIKAPPAGFRLVDNPNTLLDVADLVFFDPAGTGFSRVAPGVDPNSQFGNVADSRQLAALVTEWTKAHGRTGSPLYLVGESYGTMRAPEAAHQLLQSGTAIDGMVLLGQAVNIVEYSQRRGNIVSYAVSLPTLAAIAWSHGKAEAKGRSFDQFIKDAQDFAASDYLPVLFQGDTAPIERQRAVAEKLQAFTGLPADWYLAHQLRITKVDYQRTLLPGQRLATNDARYAGPAEGPDPFEAVPQTFGTLFKSYLASDLGAGSVGEYGLASPYTGGFNGWNWGPSKSPFGDWPYGQAITEQMEKNPRFRLLIGNGWTDTQTTVGAMDLLVSQSGWPRDRVRTRYYVGGHMAYTVEASLKAITDDVRALVTRKW